MFGDRCNRRHPQWCTFVYLLRLNKSVRFMFRPVSRGGPPVAPHWALQGSGMGHTPTPRRCGGKSSFQPRLTCLSSPVFLSWAGWKGTVTWFPAFRQLCNLGNETPYHQYWLGGSSLFPLQHKAQCAIKNTHHKNTPTCLLCTSCIKM